MVVFFFRFEMSPPLAAGSSPLQGIPSSQFLFLRYVSCTLCFRPLFRDFSPDSGCIYFSFLFRLCVATELVSDSNRFYRFFLDLPSLLAKFLQARDHQLPSFSFNPCGIRARRFSPRSRSMFFPSSPFHYRWPRNLFSIVPVVR